MAAVRVYTVVCVATLVFVAVYLAPLAGLGAELWYLPLERSWSLGAKPPGIGMDWYGRTLFAVIGSGGAAVLTALLTRRSGREAARPGWSVVLALTFAVALAAYASTLWDRPLGG